MWLGLTSQQGQLFIDATAPDGNDLSRAGIRIKPLGVVRTVEAAPASFINGFGVSALGQLCVAPGGVIANFHMGLPRTSDGRLVTQLNNAPFIGDSYVAGVRVGPLGGVYTVDVNPPVLTAWSSGFSNGYGM